MLCFTKPHPLLKPLEPRWTNRAISEWPNLQFLFHRSSRIWYRPGTSVSELMLWELEREEEEDRFSWCVIPRCFSLSAFLEQRGIQMCFRNSDIMCLIRPVEMIFR